MSRLHAKKPSDSAIVGMIVALTVASPVAGGEPISLAPRFEFGAKTHYVSRSIVENTIDAELLDVAQEVVLNSESGMSLLVSEVDSNGNAELVWTQHYVALTSDEEFPGIGARLDYDSRDSSTAGSPIAPAFSRWVAKPVRMRVDRRGEIIRFDAPDVDAGGGPAGQLAASFFSREAFAQLPLFITRGSPAKVTVRDAWSRRQEIEVSAAGVNLEMFQDFVLRRLKPRGRSALLDMTGRINSAATGGTPQGGGILPGGAPLQVESGTVRGNFEWDYANGVLVSGESELELTTYLDTNVGKMNLGQKMTASIRRVSEREFERRASRGSKKRKRGDR